MSAHLELVIESPSGKVTICFQSTLMSTRQLELFVAASANQTAPIELVARPRGATEIIRVTPAPMRTYNTAPETPSSPFKKDHFS
jgi:hypothetical protein